MDDADELEFQLKGYNGLESGAPPAENLGKRLLHDF